MFVISDDLHDESAGEFSSLEEAVSGARRLATIAWDQEPNLAPCTAWRTCGRNYEVIEFDHSSVPWREVRRFPAFEIDASGVRWADGFPRDGS